jgi:hypothetical protein
MLEIQKKLRKMIIDIFSFVFVFSFVTYVTYYGIFIRFQHPEYTDTELRLVFFSGGLYEPKQYKLKEK